MTWHSGSLLWLLSLVPVLIGALVWGWRMRRAAGQRFGSTGDELMVRGRQPTLRVARAVLLVAAVVLAIVALARPQYGSRTRMLRKRGVDVVVVLDFSKSMLAQDVRPNRIDRAKVELVKFISELDGDRIGLVAFAGETMEFPMTVDYSAATLFFRDLGPYDMPVGGTAIGRALVAAKRLLQRANRGEKADEPETHREKVVILMTDGEDHEGDPLAAAEELKEIGARVYVLGIGSRTGEMIPTHAEDGTWTGYLRDADNNPVLTSLSGEAEVQLKRIAEITGGKYLPAGRGQVGISSVRAEMRHMKQTELEARRVTVHEERYALVLLVAFLLLVLESLLPEGWLHARRREVSP